MSEELLPYREYEDLVSTELLKNASSHKDATDGFSPLLHLPETYQFQRIDCRRYEGTNATPEKMRETAQLIVPETEQIIEYLKEERTDLLTHAADKLETSRKLKLVTNHQNVIGVMVLGGALLCALYEEGYFDKDQIRTALFVSDMIKYTSLHGIDATVNVLGGLITDTFFTLPPSKSIKDTAIPENVRKKVNEVAVNEHEELENAEMPLFTILAGSGTRDIYKGRSFGKNRNSRMVHLGPMAYGTGDLLGTSWFIPGGLDMRKRQSPAFFYGRMTKPSSDPLDQHIAMHAIQEGMTEATGIQHKYHTKRESFFAISNKNPKE